MPPNDLIPGVETRYALYELDERARSRIIKLWPVIAPHLEGAVDAILKAMLTLPHVAAVARDHHRLLKKLETAHLAALLSTDLGMPYIESCCKTVQQEAELGLDARYRSTCGNFVLRAALDALARRYRFSPRKLARDSRLISQVIAFDVVNAITLHRVAAEGAAAKRRAVIDAAIADFAGAIGDVLKAITEASTSLTATCSNMRAVADDTLNRMAIASAAAAETTQRVKATGEATAELSGSIQHIGHEATRGLEMARAAVGDTQRTHQAILSLNDTAERIGSIVSIISTIAKQTNLLSLNATIEAARAGDTGKGFAVVASEVKVLANETSRATEEISQQVASIQDATRKSVGEIASVARAIEQLSMAATSIASAVEQQSATTRHIAGSIQDAAGNTASASAEILSVEQAASRSATAFAEIASLTERVSARAKDLESKVSEFVGRVRAA